MRLFCILSVILLCGSAMGQVTFDRLSHNFGLLQGDDPRVTDFVLHNFSDSDHMVISVRADREVAFLLSEREICADSSIILRVQINPFEEGLFSKTIEVYVSSAEEPIKLRVSGIARNIGDIRRQQCPDFSEPRKRASSEHTLAAVELLLLDSALQVPVRSAVVVFSNAEETVTVRADRQGKASGELRNGLYQLKIAAPGYKDFAGTLYVTRNLGLQEISLVPELKDTTQFKFEVRDSCRQVAMDITATRPVISRPGLNTPAKEAAHEAEPLAAVKTMPEKEIVAEPEQPQEEAEPETKAGPPILYPQFPAEEYSPNNVVFLIDRSSSMGNEQKLVLLKISMRSLVDLLRPIDRLCIVSYGTNSEVLLASVPVNDKQEIIRTIEAITPSGNTNAAKGIRQAYALADSAFIAEGNNEIFLATDGAFAQGTEKTYSMIHDFALKGIRLSVIGIKNGDWAEKQLREISSIGKGNFISIDNQSEARKVLVNQIKQHSLKEQ